MPAVHGPWCNAITWPTTCPNCGDRVFFFKCDHGSKVFFDELGSPWLVHDMELCWTRNLKRTRRPDGGIAVELNRGITVQRPPTGEISPEVVDAARRRARRPDPIRRVVPAQQVAEEVVGVLRELQPRVDVYGKLKLPRTAFAAAALGVLGKGDWGQVTVHEQAADAINSYTFWMPADLLRRSGSEKGLTVLVGLRVVRYSPDGQTTWVCEECEVLG